MNAALAAGLSYVDSNLPGFTRLRKERGNDVSFRFLDLEGVEIVDPGELERIRAIAIPPAWNEVWICPDPRGHIQATGKDAAGRRQYRYHPEWRKARDQEKFEKMLHFARSLPRLRRRVKRGLTWDELDRDRVLACCVRLLDLGAIRIGSEEYRDSNDSYGLATLEKRHILLEEPNAVLFDYVGKSGVQRRTRIEDAEAFDVIAQLFDEDPATEQLFHYREDTWWIDVRSFEINEWIKEASGDDEFSAKDFRTWAATVQAAALIASAEPAASLSAAAKRRAITGVVKEVATYMGNTPAVCRASYIDPRVFQRWEEGKTIVGTLIELPLRRRLPASHRARIDAAVIDLLEDEITPITRPLNGQARAVEDIGQTLLGKARKVSQLVLATTIWH